MHQCSLGLLLPVGVELGFCEQGCARIPGHQGGWGGGDAGWGRASKVANCGITHFCLSCSATVPEKKCLHPRDASKGTETKTKLEVTLWKISDTTWILFEHITLILPNYFCFMRPTIQFEEVYGSRRIWATLCILIVGRGFAAFSSQQLSRPLLRSAVNLIFPIISQN